MSIYVYTTGYIFSLAALLGTISIYICFRWLQIMRTFKQFANNFHINGIYVFKSPELLESYAASDTESTLASSWRWP